MDAVGGGASSAKARSPALPTSQPAKTAATAGAEIAFVTLFPLKTTGFSTLSW